MLSDILNNNFECICSDKPRIHFPKIIKHDENELEFELTHCGNSFPEPTWGTSSPLAFEEKIMAPLRERMGGENPPEPDKQIQCIIHNLKINKIIHHGICGSHLCIDEKGNLSLIDFDECDIYGCEGYEGRYKRVFIGSAHRKAHPRNKQGGWDGIVPAPLQAFEQTGGFNSSSGCAETDEKHMISQLEGVGKTLMSINRDEKGKNNHK